MESSHKNIELLNRRKIFLIGDIDSETIQDTIKDLVLLNSTTEDVFLYVCSEGGYMYDGLALIDTMEMVKYDINTVVMGSCSSMAAVIVTCGTKGKRFIMPHGRLMFHEGSAEMEGTVNEIKNELAEFEKLETIFNKIVAKRTGKNVKTVIKDIFSIDLWLDAKAAIKYRAIDKIWTPDRERKSNKLKSKDGNDK